MCIRDRKDAGSSVPTGSGTIYLPYYFNPIIYSYNLQIVQTQPNITNTILILLLIS